MGELSLLDEERLAQVRCIVRTMYEGLVARVILDIKELPADCCTSSDDSELANVWEEFKYQKQREQSFFFEAYELTIRGICSYVIEDLSREQQGLLWLWSDGCLDVDLEEEEIPHGYPVKEALQQELYRRVCTVACNEELAIDPDVERDLERFDEDRRMGS